MEKFPVKKGTFLVASPGLVDPNFVRAVILVCEHNEDGTMGLIVNRPTSVALDQILPKELIPPGPAGHAFQGGPVQTDHILFLHGLAEPDLQLNPICKGVYLGGTPDGLQKAFAAENGSSGPVRCYLGYAGWGAGQLDEELRQGAWVIRPAEAAEVFAVDPATLWARLTGLGSGVSPLGPVTGPDLN